MVPEDIFTPVNSIGEFGMIARMKAIVNASIPDDVICGIGDDAAVYAAPDGMVGLVTTDVLVEHIHFDRTYTPMRHLGYKAISVNVSDIAAMNGNPQYATVSIGLPNTISIEMIDALYAGMQDAAEEYGLTIVGGDTTGAHKLFISVTMIGSCSADAVTLRSSASPGDLLCVSGSLGASYAGMRLLQHHKERLEIEGPDYAPDLSKYTRLIQRHLRPTARMDIVAALKSAGIKPTAAIDISDGFASELQHICLASGCGADVDWTGMPADPSVLDVVDQFDDDIDDYFLHGGEDYELLFTVCPDDREAVSLLSDVRIVGVCSAAKSGINLARDGADEVIGGEGFQHFDR